MINTLPKSLLEAATIVLEASLYESLLLEDRIQFLKDKNPQIDTSHDTLAKHRDAASIIDHFAQHADPSKNKQHTQWILGQYKKQNIRQEDASRIHTALSNFDRYKSKLDKKDINAYKSVSGIENAVHPHLGTAATKAEVQREAAVKGRILVHDDGAGLKVYRLEATPEGKKASQDIYGGGHHLGGTHTSWCTAARSDDCMFDDYAKAGSELHVIHTPTGKVYQAHTKSRQIMNAKDDDVTAEHPDIHHISKALDHVPDGWKLKLHKGISGIPKEHLDKALNDGNTYIRAVAARSPHATKEHLDKALNDIHPDVRASGASHPNATKEHLDKALNDTEWQVREAAASHPNATKEHLDKAIADEDHTVRIGAASHPNATKEHLDKALGDDNYWVREAAASHPNATKEHLDKALNDDNYWVRMYAASNPNATKEHLDKALLDKARMVRNAAESNPNAKKFGLV